MKLSSRDRFVWLVAGVLLIAWLAGILANFVYKDYWTAGSVKDVLYGQDTTLPLVAALVLLVSFIAWQMYSLGIAEFRKQADLERHYREELEEAYRGTLHALTSALDLRDDETYGHSRRVVGYSLAIGKRLGLSEEDLRTLAWGALLHDIGKIGIPDRILLKPSPLSPEERAEMNQHPVIGSHLVQNVPFLARTADLIRHHHERFDGTGYPDRLKGEEIPAEVRIFAVADAFDAMTSSRPYRREPLTMPEARRVIAEGAGSQFCPQAAAVFSDIPLAELEQIRADSFRPVEFIGDLIPTLAAPKDQYAPSYYRDVLTGVQNRAAWEAKRSKMSLTRGRMLGIIFYLDLDGLKEINDTHGHLSGDRVLADLGARLSQVSREVYRMGGDEFLLWLPEETPLEALRCQVTDVLSLFSHDWAYLGCATSVSWGSAQASKETGSLEELLNQADQRMYACKSAKQPKRAVLRT